MKLRDWPWGRWMSVFVVVGIGLVLWALITPAVQQARVAAWRSTSKNNLKQLGIALHNYHDTYDCFPPGGVVNDKGVAFHGWYTSIMPFIDASPLYSMVNFDYPWTDLENSHLFQRKIPVILMPSAREEYTSEGFALIHYLGNPNLLHRNSSVSLYDLEAGAGKTWFLGEVAGNYQPWGYPFNWRALGPRLNAGPDSYGRPTGEGACLLLADGSVEFFKDDVDPEILQAFADAPPNAPAEATTVPARRFEYGKPTWTTSSLDLDEDDDYEGLHALASYDSSHSLRSVTIYPKGKAERRATTLRDLKAIAARYPDAPALFRVSFIDDPAAEVLSGMKQLERLQAESLAVTEAGVSALQQLPKLRVLQAAMSEETQHRLTEALPECELRSTRDTSERIGNHSETEP